MKSTTTTSPTREIGWLPDCVYTGGRFEAEMAFFADALGRITRFSREPADLDAAKRLAGQAALPGLVNGHSQALQRVMRGRGEAHAGARFDDVAARLTPDDVYETARMAFLEMLLSGITCVGEFHSVHHQPDGTPWPEANTMSFEVLRAARDTGIRLALHKVASARTDAAARCGVTPDADQFVRELEALREQAGREYPGDEIWLGAGVAGVDAVPLEYLKAVSAYAHAQRFRLQIPLATTLADHEAWSTPSGRTAVTWLAEHGIVDKRLTAIHASHLADDDVRALGAARAAVCACPTTARVHGAAVLPAENLLTAGVTLAFGSGSQVQINLLEEARALEYQLRARRGEPAGIAAPRDVAAALLHAATAAGARSLGAPSGALEVGRPADFFTVNIYDPSLAGAEPGALLANIVFSLERRAVREVWIGARQRVAHGRHLHQGPIVGRFVELQRRLWAES